MTALAVDHYKVSVPPSARAWTRFAPPTIPLDEAGNPPQEMGASPF
jgi:hypothetical protein